MQEALGEGVSAMCQLSHLGHSLASVFQSVQQKSLLWPVLCVEWICVGLGTLSTIRQLQGAQRSSVLPEAWCPEF